MTRSKLSPQEKAFIDQVCDLETKLFPDQLDEGKRMKSERYSWHYKPSHHAETGLVTFDDLKGKRILSVGAFPAYFEQILVELGLPKDNIIIADNDPAIATIDGMTSVVFDAVKPWPELGTFDLIIFPESLCICMSDLLKSEKTGDGKFPTDTLEAKLLAGILGEALKRLKPNGEIRANGPMSHPNVVAAAKTHLEKAGCTPQIDYQRYFLTVRLGDGS